MSIEVADQFHRVHHTLAERRGVEPQLGEAARARGLAEDERRRRVPHALGRGLATGRPTCVGQQPLQAPEVDLPADVEREEADQPALDYPRLCRGLPAGIVWHARSCSRDAGRQAAHASR
jgi:hypothetical protein